MSLEDFNKQMNLKLGARNRGLKPSQQKSPDSARSPFLTAQNFRAPGLFLSNNCKRLETPNYYSNQMCSIDSGMIEQAKNEFL